jgi:outer membrane receptor protein involved in Fe transport
VVSGSFSDAPQTSESRTVISDSASNRVNSVLLATALQPTTRFNLNNNVNYRFADTSGHELGIDVDYGLFSYVSSSNQPNIYKNSDETQTLQESGFGIDYGTTVRVFTAKTDYEQHFFKGKIGIGGKYSNIVTGNSFAYFNGTGAARTQNFDQSNSFAYTENINALYANYTREINKKWSTQAGLRTEQTNSLGVLTSNKASNDSDVKRSYLDFFPSAALTFTPNQIHSFNLTYSRRIDRPSYQDLNPFENKIDLLTYEKGNPYLRPQYSNAFELTHTLMGFINTTLSASRTDDFFTQLTDTLAGGKTFIIQRNLGKVDNLGLNIAAPLPFAKWYDGFLNIGSNLQHYSADFGKGKTIERDILSWTLYMQNTFNFGKGWAAELSGFYASPGIWGGTFITNQISNVDIGVQKKVLNENALVKLSFSDVFHTQRWSGVTQFGGLYMRANGGWESQRLTLSFNYRFGNQQMKDVRAHKGGNEDESKRMKVGK